MILVKFHQHCSSSRHYVLKPIKKNFKKCASFQWYKKLLGIVTQSIQSFDNNRQWKKQHASENNNGWKKNQSALESGHFQHQRRLFLNQCDNISTLFGHKFYCRLFKFYLKCWKFDAWREWLALKNVRTIEKKKWWIIRGGNFWVATEIVTKHHQQIKDVDQWRFEMVHLLSFFSVSKYK